MLQVLAQMVGGFANLALARQKHQNVAALATGPELIHALGNRIVEVEVLLLLERAITHLHRKRAARDHDDRRRSVLVLEMLGKPIGIDRGRGHHHLQIGPLGQDLADVAEQKVDVQTALVRLVDDQRVVGLEQGIGLRLGQQDTVGHQLDRGILLQLVLEPHAVTDHFAERRVQLLGNPLGHGRRGNPARLGVTDEVAAHLALLVGNGIDLATPQRQRDLG